MTKKMEIDSAWEDYKNPTDLQEWLDHVNSEMEYDLQNMDSLEERLRGNYFNRPDKNTVMLCDNYWDVESPDYMGYIWNEDHYMYMEDVFAEGRRIAALQWHHIEPVNDPYWKQCVDLIEEKLNEKL